MMPPIAILAGGLATRLGDLAKVTPKNMLTVAGHPFVHHQLLWLYSEGIRDVVMCVGYLGKEIEAFVGNGSQYGIKVVYSYDGSRPIGTGGAIKRALPLLSDNFFVIYGDTYLNVTFSRILTAFEWADKIGLMTVYENDGKWGNSNVEMNSDGIIKYSKTPEPSMHYIDYGLEIFSRKTFDKIPLETFDLSDVHQELIATGQLATYEVHKRFYEIGTPEALAETEAFLRSK